MNWKKEKLIEISESQNLKTSELFFEILRF